MRINHNIAALNTYRQLTIGGNNATKAMEKLSSGLRINRAGDDAAGLAISEKMRGQIRGLEQASRNAQDGISLIQTAEGALNETHSILQRMRELAVQAASDTNVQVDRIEIQKEVDELAKEITRIANNTEFNTQKLINGGITDGNVGSLKFHVGANAAQDITLSINAMDAKSLGVSRDLVTISGTGAGIIGNVTFDSVVGGGIVGGATITFSYASTPDSPATAAEITAENPANATTNLSGISEGAELVITIDGTSRSLNKTELVNATGSDKSITDLQAAIAAKISPVDSSVGPSVGSVTVDGNMLKIISNSTGSTSSVQVTVTGTDADAAAVMAAFGFTNGQSATGTDAVPASKTVTISDGTNTQVVSVADETATSLSVTDGLFRGMTITLSSGDLSGLDDDNDTVTVNATVSAATAAVFSGGALQQAAVAEAGIDVSSQSAASAAITTIQKAIETVSAERSKLGAYQNRLEHTIANLGTSSENLTAAESRIRDVDMAKEMMEFTKSSILTQAAQAMLAQANQQPQGVLQLLR